MEKPSKSDILKAQESVANQQRDFAERARQVEAHYNKLLYQLFQENKLGGELLNIWISKYLVSQPCADPEKDSAFAFKREGENGFIRCVIEGIQSHVKGIEHG